MASCSIPIVFPVYTIGHLKLIDGGFLSDWYMNTEVSEPSETLLIQCSHHSKVQTQSIQNWMEYVNYLLYSGIQNVHKLDPAMKPLVSKLKYNIDIPFHTTSFSMKNLHTP